MAVLPMLFAGCFTVKLQRQSNRKIIGRLPALLGRGTEAVLLRSNCTGIATAQYSAQIDFVWNLPRESGIPIITIKWVATVPAAKGRTGSTHQAENDLDLRNNRAAGNYELIEES